MVHRNKTTPSLDLSSSNIGLFQ